MKHKCVASMEEKAPKLKVPGLEGYPGGPNPLRGGEQEDGIGGRLWEG